MIIFGPSFGYGLMIIFCYEQSFYFIDRNTISEGEGLMNYDLFKPPKKEESIFVQFECVDCWGELCSLYITILLLVE